MMVSDREDCEAPDEEGAQLVLTEQDIRQTKGCVTAAEQQGKSHALFEAVIAGWSWS